MASTVEIALSVNIDGENELSTSRFLQVQTYSHAGIDLPMWPAREEQYPSNPDYATSDAITEAENLKPPMDVTRIEGTGQDGRVVKSDVNRVKQETEREKTLPDTLPKNAGSVRLLLLTATEYGEKRIRFSLTEDNNGDPKFFELDQPLLLYGEQALDRLTGTPQEELNLENKTPGSVTVNVWVGWGAS